MASRASAGANLAVVVRDAGWRALRIYLFYLLFWIYLFYLFILDLFFLFILFILDASEHPVVR